MINTTYENKTWTKDVSSVKQASKSHAGLIYIYWYIKTHLDSIAQSVEICKYHGNYWTSCWWPNVCCKTNALDYSWQFRHRTTFGDLVHISNVWSVCDMLATWWQLKPKYLRSELVSWLFKFLMSFPNHYNRRNKGVAEIWLACSCPWTSLPQPSSNYQRAQLLTNTNMLQRFQESRCRRLGNWRF